MYKLLLVSHGELCKGILNAGKMILGDVEDIEYVSLTDEGVDTFEKRLKEKLENIRTECKDILVLADLFGGTPFNKSFAESVVDKNIKIVTGLNLPMLIESSINSGGSLEDGYNAALTAGQQGVRTAEVTVSNDEDDE
ncbi:MAG: PTS sugar transporter subunit IIA [Sarcina sp.]